MVAILKEARERVAVELLDNPPQDKDLLFALAHQCVGMKRAEQVLNDLERSLRKDEDESDNPQHRKQAY